MKIFYKKNNLLTTLIVIGILIYPVSKSYCFSLFKKLSSNSQREKTGIINEKNEEDEQKEAINIFLHLQELRNSTLENIDKYWPKILNMKSKNLQELQKVISDNFVEFESNMNVVLRNNLINKVNMSPEKAGIINEKITSDERSDKLLEYLGITMFVIASPFIFATCYITTEVIYNRPRIMNMITNRVLRYLFPGIYPY